MFDLIDSCLMLDHMARPQTAFELQKALMKDIKDLPESSPAATEEERDDTLTGRLRKTLNRKIF
jgi:hypothetical protein